MANNRVQYTLAFSADTKQAKAQLNALQSQITNLINSSAKSTGQGLMSKEIHEASVAAAQLKAQLLGATNATTGKLDLTKFNQSLQASNMSIEKYKNALLTLGPEGAQVFANLATSITQAEVPMLRLSDKVKDLGKTLSNTVKWQISSSVIHGFMGAIQGAYGYAQDLNKSLNNIRIVTSQSTDQMAAFAEKANKAAKALSTTTTTYTDAALIYYQQGLNDEQVEERTNATIKMANVTGENATNVSSYMTAIWNNFAKGGDDLEYFADVITALGAATAASSEEIAGGLEKFAAVGETVGLSYEYATSALTTIIDKTRQSEDVVGTALKTIFARIQGLQQGEASEDGVTLNKYSQALENVGISIMDTNGELKTMDSILDEMGSKWETLSKAQQVALAQTVGGTRQYTQLIALMENWDAMQENLNTAYGSTGTLEKQAEIYEESWEAASDRVRASLETIYNQLLNDDFFIGLNNTLSKMIDGISKLIDSLGGVKGLFFLLGTLGIKVFKTQIGESIIGVRNTFLNFTSKGRKQLEELRDTANSALQSLYTDTATDYGQLVGSAYKTQATAQQDFLNITKDLNEEQRKTAQILLDQHSALVNNAVEQGKIVEEAEELVNIEMRRSQKNIEMQKGKKNKATKEDLGNYKQALEQYGNFKGLFENAFERISVSDKEKVSQADALMKSLRKEYQDTSVVIAKFGEEGEAAFKQLEEAIKSGDPDQVEKALNNMARTVDKLEDSARKAKKPVKDIVTKDFTTNVLHAAEQTGGLTAKILKLRINGDNLKSSFKELSTTIRNTTQNMVNLAQHMSSIAGGVMAIGSLKDTWSDESDASLLERITSSIMTLGYALPMLKTGLSGAKKEIVEIGTKLAAQKAITAGTTAETVGFAGSIKLILGTFAPYIAAIGVIVGLLALLYLEYTKDARALEKANKNLKEQKTILNETTAAWNELKSTIENYENSQKAIEELTKGTEEWKDAIQDANQEVLELMNKYPELVDYIETNSDGLMTISEDGLNLIKEKQRDSVNAAQRGVYTAQVSANSAENRSLKTDTARSIKYTQTDSEGNTYTSTVSQSMLDKVLTAMDKNGNAIFKSVDDLMEATGIENRAVAEALYDNRESLLKLDTTIDANTKANTLLQQEMAKSFLDSHDDINKAFKDSAYADEIAAKYGQMTGPDSQKYKENLKMVNSASDAEIQKLYAEKMGWDVTSIANKTGKGVYHLADGTERTVDDEMARAFLAQEMSLEGSVTSLTAITEEINKLVSLTDNADAKNTLAGIYAGTGDLSTLSNEGYAALGQISGDALKSILGEEGYANYQTQYQNYDAEAAEEKRQQQYQAKKSSEASAIVAEEGFDQNIVDAYAESLMEVNENLKEQEGLAELIAAKNMRMNKGLDSLQENYEDNAKAIKKNSKTSAEYIEAMVEMKDAVADVLNVDTSSLSNDFIEENLDKIKAAANGSAEAIEELRLAAGKDIIANIELNENATITKEKFIEEMNEISNQIYEFSKNNQFEIGAQLDSEDFINNLNEMIKASGMTADQVNEYFKAMGYDAELTTQTKTMDAWMDVPETTYKLEGFSLKPHTTITRIKYQKEEQVPAVKVITSTGSAGGGINFTNTKKGGATTKKGSSGGSSKKKEAKEVERYHTVNKQLETLEKNLDSVSKAKDRAFSEKDRLKNMEKEIALYDDIIAKEKEKMALIEKDLTKDKNKVIEIGAKIDENGAITNYQQLMDKWNQQYLNGSLSEEKFEEYIKLIEQYEETWTAWQDQGEKIAEETANKISAELENIQIEIEAKVKFNDQELEYLDFLLSKIEDKTFAAAETMSLLGQKTKETLDQYNINVEELYKLMEQTGLSLDEAMAVMQGSASQEILDKINDKQEDAFLELGKKFMDGAQALGQLKDAFTQELIDAIHEGVDAYAELGEEINHVTSTLQHYQNLIDILGEDALGIGAEEVSELMQSTVDSSIANLANSQKSLEWLKSERERLTEALKGASDSEKESINKALEDLDKQIRDAESQAQSDLESVLNMIVEQFTLHVKQATDAFEKAMSGTFGSLDKLQEAFDRQKELDDLYIDDYKKVYELTKLTRDIGKSIDETDNLKAKQALRDLQQEINDLQQDGVQLSEYDIDMLNKKYELQLAQIALEEAQNAKSQVRMTKDSEGNWSYTYTADEDSIANAEQNYEDKLYAMQELNQEYLKNLQGQILAAQAAMSQAIRNLGPNAGPEEVAAITQHYQAIIDAHSQQMQNALGDSNYALGFMTEETEGWVNSFDETTLSTLTGFESLESYQAAFVQSTQQMVDDIGRAFETYNINVDKAMDTAGLSVEGFGETLEKVQEQAKEDLEEIEKDSELLSKDVARNVGDALAQLQSFYDNYGASVDSATSSTWGLIEALEELSKAKAQEEKDNQNNNNNQDNNNNNNNQDNNKSTGPTWNKIKEAYDKINGGVWGDGINTRIAAGKAAGFSEQEVRLAQKLINLRYGGMSESQAKKALGFDTGGYTGDWGNSGKLAVLHQKELVLNADDTQNMLKSIEMVRAIARTIDLNNGMTLGWGGLSSSGVGSGKSEIIQDITINAEFPYATERSEIEAAFDSLFIRASQYANRK